MNEPTTGPDEMIDNPLPVLVPHGMDPAVLDTALVAGPWGRQKSFEPGLPSTSRKKRRQVNSRDARKMVVKDIKPSHPKSRQQAKRRARKAMGARGVKTNSQRSGRN